MPSFELPLAEIPADKLVGLEYDGQPILVVRKGNDIAAFVDRCPHAGWKLSDGDLRDGVVECAGHSWEFNAGDGQCVTVPGHCLTALSAIVHGDSVHIEWSDNIEDE